MKRFVITLGLFLTSFAGYTQASSSIFLCGEMKISSELISSIKNPTCIAYKKDLKTPVSGHRVDQAWVSGTDKQNKLIVVALEYERDTPAEYELEGVSRVGILELKKIPSNTIEYYAFEENCGISLLTAKIIDRDTTLLFFDNLTVLKVSPVIAFPKIETLTSKYDPNSVYACGGYQQDRTAYDSLITINEMKKSVDYKQKGRGTITVKY